MNVEELKAQLDSLLAQNKALKENKATKAKAKPRAKKTKGDPAPTWMGVVVTREQYAEIRGRLLTKENKEKFFVCRQSEKIEGANENLSLVAKLHNATMENMQLKGVG